MSRLIDADALKLSMMLIAPGETKKYCYPCKEIFKEIDSAPTIEERKTGKWIIEPYDAQNDIFIHRCGTCMRVAMLGGHTTKFKYCPICGSAMTEGEQP